MAEGHWEHELTFSGIICIPRRSGRQRGTCRPTRAKMGPIWRYWPLQAAINSTSGVLRGDVCAKPRRFRQPARSTRRPTPRTRSPSRSRYLPTAAAAAATPRRRCAQPGRVLRRTHVSLGMNFSTTFSTIAIAGRSRPPCSFVWPSRIGNKPAGRLEMTLRADVCPKTCENFRCTGEKARTGHHRTFRMSKYLSPPMHDAPCALSCSHRA